VLPCPLLRSGEERDPVTRLLSDPTGFASGPVELRTSDGRNLHAPEAQTSAAAGVSLSKQTMHRAHDPDVETFGRTGNRLGSQNPSPQLRATFLVHPVRRGSRAYMGGPLGCQTVNCRCLTGYRAGPKCLSNLLYCCGPAGFPASICSYPQ